MERPSPLTPEQQTEIAALRERSAPTRRATVPAMEELLYTPIPVLDHGFIRVIDYMGDDAAIVQAARVSYGAGTKRARDDAGLIGYLMRNRHTSPFEMCEIKLHVKLPIFVARQWIRHRTACLAGDTRLYFDLPNAVKRGRRSRRSISIAKLFRLWHEGSTHSLAKKKPTHAERIDPVAVYTVPQLAKLVERREESIRNMIRAGYLQATKEVAADPRQPQLTIRGADWIAWSAWEPTARVNLKGRLQRAQLRMCDEATGEIRHTNVVDIWQTGVRPVFKVTLEGGRSLVMTKDHRCLTAAGWMTLEEATGLRRGDHDQVTWRQDHPPLAVNGVPAHRDAEWLKARRADGLDVQAIADRAGVSYMTIRNALKRHGLSFMRSCHRQIHAGNLELAFLEAVTAGGNVDGFWATHTESAPRPIDKRRGRSTRLVRGWARIARIEYAGEQMTYDLEVNGPYHNFVAEGFIVHNSVNEYSARYSILDREFYVPAPEHLAAQDTDNRQGRAAPLPADQAQRVLDILREDAMSAYEHYEDLLNETADGSVRRPDRVGIARELARINLPVSIYTQWYWKADLHNLLRFIELRADAHAQYEIRAYADVLGEIVKAWVPHTHAAFVDYQLGSLVLSAKSLAVVKRLLAGETVTRESSGLSAGEWRELMETLGRSSA